MFSHGKGVRELSWACFIRILIPFLGVRPSWATHLLKSSPSNIITLKSRFRSYLVAPWLGGHLPVQRTRGPVLVRDDPTPLGATNSVCCNYWAPTPPLVELCVYGPCFTTREATAMRRPRSPSREWPSLATTRDSLWAATKIQCSQKKREKTRFQYMNVRGGDTFSLGTDYTK